MAIACFAERAPCLPSRICSISSRTNSPACVESALPSPGIFSSSVKGLLFRHRASTSNATARLIPYFQCLSFGQLPHNLSSGFVPPDTDESWMAQFTVPGPFGEGELGDQFWFSQCDDLPLMPPGTGGLSTSSDANSRPRLLSVCTSNPYRSYRLSTKGTCHGETGECSAGRDGIGA
jgi:hypothetical protein